MLPIVSQSDIYIYIKNVAYCVPQKIYIYIYMLPINIYIYVVRDLLPNDATCSIGAGIRSRYKSDETLSVAEQKCCVVPDIYEVGVIGNRSYGSLSLGV